MTVAPFNAVDRCVFNATSNGTGDFVVASAVRGYQTPAAAAAVDGEVYSYAAQSADLGQWEVGQGAYTVGSTTLARTTVLFNSLGTTAKINFSSSPQVLLSIAAEDINNLTINSVIIGAGADYSQDSGKLVIQDTYRTLQSSVYWGADTLGCRQWWMKSRGTTLNSHVAVVSGDDVAALYFAGSDGSAWQVAARIFASCDGTVASLTVPGRLSFWTTASGAQFPVERMRIDSSGTAGIGTGGTNFSGIGFGNLLILANTAAIGQGLLLLKDDSADALGADLNFAKSRSAAYSGWTVVQSGDNLGRLTWYGADGTTGRLAARIEAFVDATPGASDMPGRLVFSTTPDGSATLSERLRITNQGQVWIANPTAVPSAGGTVGTTAMALQFSSTSDFGIFVGSGVPTVAAATGSIYLRTDGTSTTTRLYVRTNSGTWATFTASA